jgi:hypothetical protein
MEQSLSLECVTFLGFMVLQVDWLLAADMVKSFNLPDGMVEPFNSS